MLASFHFYMKGAAFCVKTKSTRTPFPLKGQVVTENTNVKWAILRIAEAIIVMQKFIIAQ